MLAAMLGNNREIFFPKLDEAQMMTFDAIAVELLKEHGFEPRFCGSDEEAIAYAKEHLSRAGGIKDGQGVVKYYPVRFSASDTSGEKDFEEFCVEGETVDLNSYAALGVITDKQIPDREAVAELINRLEHAFDTEDCDKGEIVRIIGDYLPNFNHIETGKSLDGKM